MSLALRICSRMLRTQSAKRGRSLGAFSIRAAMIWRVTCTFLCGAVVSLGTGDRVPRGRPPYPLAVDIAGRLLLQEAADLLDLCAARLNVEQQVAQLARVRLDVDGALGGSGVAFQHEDLVLRPTSLLQRIHGGRRVRIEVVVVGDGWELREGGGARVANGSAVCSGRRTSVGVGRRSSVVGQHERGELMRASRRQLPVNCSPAPGGQKVWPKRAWTQFAWGRGRGSGAWGPGL
jgi:hypothetical protein